MYFKERMNWQMPWSTTTLSPRQKQLYLSKSYWGMYRRAHMGLVVMRHSKTSFLMSLSSKDGSKMDSLSRQGLMIFCWIQIPSTLNGTMIGQDCLWSPYWADLTVGECPKLTQYEWIDLRWISISSAVVWLRAGESASSWHRHWEPSKGPVRRSRAVYAKLESHSELERARVCQRVAVRASESQSGSHREP